MGTDARRKLLTKRLAGLLFASLALASIGATHRTPNFVVEASSPQIAKQVADAAEHYRSELSQQWLGKRMPRWWRPCHVQVREGQIGAGGATTFAFDRGEVFGWKMTVQGSLERILDSVIPHEVSHTVFACYFRQPLPRWADEGAATLAEDESEKRRQQRMVEQVLHTKQRIPLRKLFAIKEYPRDMQHVLTLYAQGYSLAEYLVQQGGKARYLAFLDDALSRGWDHAVKKHYNISNVDSLEVEWNEWVLAGSPSLRQPPDQVLAAVNSSNPIATERDSSDDVIRSQSPALTAEPLVETRVAASRRSEPAVARATQPNTVARIGGHAPFPRGDGLHAPNPRPANAGDRASQAGWMPLPEAAGEPQSVYSSSTQLDAAFRDPFSP